VNSPKKQTDNLWVLWLVVALLVIITLFCFGQLALMTPPDIEAGDMRSGLKADYSLWPPLSFKPLEPALIEELIEENPALPTQMVVIGAYWSSTGIPNTPTLTPSATPTTSPTASPTATALTVRPAATRRPLQPTNTRQAAIPTLAPPSATAPAPVPTQRPDTPRPTRTDTPPVSPTPTNTATQPSTSTNTPTATFTYTPSATITKSPTVTATSTRSLPTIATNTNTPTSTKAPFPTTTRTPLPDGINLGLPDSRYSNIFCSSPVIIDLGAPTQIGTLIFYEYRNQNPVGCANGICLNWVMIDLSDSGDPWPRRVFYWGDDKTTNNGSIPPTYFPMAPTPETSNLVILPADLYNGHGIQIHVDGVYRYIYIAPPSCSAWAQLDSVEIWAATMTPRP